MSEENVERARRAYTAIQEAYRAGDIKSMIDLAEEFRSKEPSYPALPKPS